MVHFKTSSPPLFQIRLEDDTLTMHGSQTESVGCVLRGQLVLVVTEPTKFKEIKLTFQGKSKVGWADGTGKGQSYHDEERILYQHNWVFLPAKDKCHILKPDNYHWDFELILPGGLPETTEGCQHGSIRYKLRAVAERNSLAVNLHTQRNITLLRSLSPTSSEFLQSAIVTGTWADRVEYEFSANSSAYSLEDTITVLINLRSIEEDLKIQSISCFFKEYTTYTVGTSQKTDSRTVGVVSENNFSQKIDTWTHLMEIPVPKICLFDSQNDLIRIQHKLRFFVKFGNNKFNCELRASLPIIVTSTPPNSDMMNLPPYNENNLDSVYFEDDCRRSNYSDLSSSSSSSSSTCSSFEEPLSEPLSDFEDLNKLPSYRSIASLIPAPLADSLLPPTYESSVCDR